MTTKAVSRNRTTKALKIIQEGRIEKASSESFRVKGDSGKTYLVTVFEGGFFDGVYQAPGGTCQCDWSKQGDGTPCAHIESARIQMSRKEDPFEGLVR